MSSESSAEPSGSQDGCATMSLPQNAQVDACLSLHATRLCWVLHWLQEAAVGNVSAWLVVLGEKKIFDTLASCFGPYYLWLSSRWLLSPDGTNDRTCVPRGCPFVEWGLHAASSLCCLVGIQHVNLMHVAAS